MMRKCHLNTCPVGVATQDPVLRARFSGQPEHVVTYLFAVADELRGLMAGLGVARVDGLVGRTDLLGTDLLSSGAAARHWKAQGLDLSALLAAPRPARHLAHVPHFDARRSVAEDVAKAAFLDAPLDEGLIDEAGEAFLRGEHVRLARTISTQDRSAGTRFSGLVARAQRDALRESEATPGSDAAARSDVETPLTASLQRPAHDNRAANPAPLGTLVVDFEGAAGQSFGAFLGRGLAFRLRGEANDYVGKGLSGGRIAVALPEGAAPGQSGSTGDVAAGNVLLYGATAGELYVAGRVGERCAVRNSGAWAVVEGCGDHGAEYMTGGRLAVLGTAGRNFGAGMSGGVAYLLDDAGDAATRVNGETVSVSPVDTDEDARDLRWLLSQHARETGSPRAAALLAGGEASLARFVRVLPNDYARALSRGLATRDAPPDIPPEDRAFADAPAAVA